jgi:hypothetical protein
MLLSIDLRFPKYEDYRGNQLVFLEFGREKKDIP